MTLVSERISIYTILQTSALAEQSFDTLLLIDHADAGANLGDYTWITQASDLTSGTDGFKWAQIYFSQSRVPRKLMVGRWTGAGATTQADALAKIMEIDNAFWAVAEIGGAAAQVENLAAAVEATKSKMGFWLTTSADAVNPAISTDPASVMKAAGYNRNSVFYSAHTDEKGYLPAAILGCVLPGDPGSVAFSWQKITAVWESGKSGIISIPLTASERTALEGKNCNYCESLAGVNVIRKGINSSNVPCNLIQGMDWMNSGIQGDLFTFMLKGDNPAFDNKTLAGVEGIVRSWIFKAVEKTIIIDSEEQPILFNFPAASSFTAAQKATGTMTLPNVYVATLNYPVQEIVLYGTWSI